MILDRGGLFNQLVLLGKSVKLVEFLRSNPKGARSDNLKNTNGPPTPQRFQLGSDAAKVAALPPPGEENYCKGSLFD